jgi:hypothetical protein
VARATSKRAHNYKKDWRMSTAIKSDDKLFGAGVGMETKKERKSKKGNRFGSMERNSENSSLEATNNFD